MESRKWWRWSVTSSKQKDLKDRRSKSFSGQTTPFNIPPSIRQSSATVDSQSPPKVRSSKKVSESPNDAGFLDRAFQNSACFDDILFDDDSIPVIIKSN